MKMPGCEKRVPTIDEEKALTRPNPQPLICFKMREIIMAGQNTYVLDFSLGDGRYCIDISHVEEIVDADEEITPVPKADDHIVGVVDLRGETTTIVDPKVSLDLDASATGRRIIVLSDMDGSGLLIDDVHQVVEVSDEDLDESTAAESTHGVIRHDDRFVVWIDPKALT